MVSTRHKSVITVRRTDGLPPIPDRFGGRWMGWGNIPDWANDVKGDINIIDKGEGFTYRINGVPVVMEGGPVTGNNGEIQWNNNGRPGASPGLKWEDATQTLVVGTGGVDSLGCFQINSVPFACPDGSGGIVLSNITNINGQPPGGAQTPWTSDIDAANFSLNNVASIQGFNNELTIGNLSANVHMNGSFLFLQANNWIQMSPKVGINNTNPAYPLDVVGDVNITGQYRINGVPIAQTLQTPWLSDIDAANFSLNNLAFISMSGVYPSINALSGSLYLVSRDNLWVTVNNLLVIRASTNAGQGYVGINLNDVQYTLDVNGDINTRGIYRVNGIPLNQIFLSLSGGTLTGPLILYGNPTQELEAATKAYVDNAVSGTLNYIGTIDASTGNCTFTTASGLVSGPLPSADQAVGSFVICTVAGTIPTGPAAGITMKVGDWLTSDGIDWSLIAVGGQTVTAASVGVSPTVFGASNVQVALQNAESITGSLQTQINNKVSSQWINGSSGAIYYTGGNVGIGTTTPNSPLNVNAAVYGTPGFANDGHALLTLSAIAVNPSISVGWLGAAPWGYWIQCRDASAYYPLSLNPSGGNVGIGVTTPTTLLSLGSALAPIKLAIYDGGPTSSYGLGIASGELLFGAGISPTSGTAQMSLSTTGNLRVIGQIFAGSGAVGNQPGDIAASRNASPTTGAIFFGNAGTAYIFYDGANFNFGGGGIAAAAFSCTSLYCSGSATVAVNLSCDGPLWLNSNIIYFAGGAQALSWDAASGRFVLSGNVYSVGSVTGANGLVAGAAGISTGGDIACSRVFANGNALYFASGAVFVSWDGTNINISHGLYTPGRVSANDVLSRGQTYLFGDGSVYIQWTGAYINHTHPISCPELNVADGARTNYVTCGGAGPIGGSVNVTGGYYINGVPFGGGAMIAIYSNSGSMGNAVGINFQSGSGSTVVVNMSAGPVADVRFDIYAISDERVKRNVRDLQGGLEIIKQLRPITAEFNGLGGYPEGDRVVSVMAQELRSILPDAIHSISRKLRSEDEESIDLLTIDNSHILFHTVLAVKQLDERVRILEAK